MRHPWRRASVASVCLVLTAVAAGAQGSSGRASASGLSAPLACGSWTVVPSPNAGSNGNTLSGVSAVSMTDAWAVGSTYNGSAYRPLTEHWDGQSWSIVHARHVGTDTNTFTAVAAVAATDVWAVGFYANGMTFRTLAEHWDGTSWSVVNTPNSGTGQNVLTAVTAVSTSDVWAVGYRQASSGSPRQTLAEHWNGSTWKVVPTPNVGADENFLWSVTARKASDAWAVGSYSVPWFQTLTEHWDGAAWKVVPSPNLDDSNNVLYAAVALKSASVTAVGTWLNGDITDTLSEHWDGSAWNVVSTPNPGGYINWLAGVAAAGPSDVWAVGWRSSQPFAPKRTLAEHWNGTSWHVERTPNVGSQSNALWAVARVPGTAEFWAVGGREKNSIDRTLIEFRC
jgi:hypothetical protein